MIELPVEMRQYALREGLHEEQMIQKYGTRYVHYQGCFAPIEMSKETRVPVLKFKGGTKEPTIREVVDWVGDLVPLGISSQKEAWARDRFLLHPSDYLMLLSHLRDEQLIHEGDYMCPFVHKIQENIFYWDDMDDDETHTFLIYVNGEYSVSANEELWAKLEGDHREILQNGWLIDGQFKTRNGRVSKFLRRFKNLI